MSSHGLLSLLVLLFSIPAAEENPHGKERFKALYWYGVSKSGNPAGRLGAGVLTCYLPTCGAELPLHYSVGVSCGLHLSAAENETQSVHVCARLRVLPLWHGNHPKGLPACREHPPPAVVWVLQHSVRSMLHFATGRVP